MISFLRHRIVEPTKDLLLNGLTPHKIALSLACGCIVGIFPVLGTTTALCVAAAILFRLNLPTVQLANYLVYPAQLALIVPFIRTGQWIFRTSQTSLSLKQMIELTHRDHTRAFQLLWRLGLEGILAWVVITPIFFVLLYWFFLQTAKRIEKVLPRKQSLGNEA